MRPWFAVALLAACGDRAPALESGSRDSPLAPCDPDDAILIDLDVLEYDGMELDLVFDAWLEVG